LAIHLINVFLYNSHLLPVVGMQVKKG